MKKYTTILMMVGIVLTLTACTEAKAPEKDPLQGVNIEDDIADGKKYRLEEKDRVQITGIEGDEFSYKKSCDNYMVENHDLSQCVFEIQNIEGTQGDCVVLCDVEIPQ